MPIVDNGLPNQERRDAADMSDEESDRSDRRVAPGVENEEAGEKRRKPVDGRTEVAERESESNADQAVNDEPADVESDLPVARSEDLESEPALIGGIEQLNRRVRFPEEVGDFPDGGTVMLEFVVSADGFVTNPVVLAGMNDDFDREALRVIRETRFRPAINTTAQPVPFKMQFDIEFTPLSSPND